MSELDRLGTAAATALLAEVTPADASAALAAVRFHGTRPASDRRRWPLMAVAAAAVVVVVTGLVVIANRNPDQQIDPPLAPVTTTPVTVPPTTTPPTTEPEVVAVPPLTEQPEFGGAAQILYVGGGEILVSGFRANTEPGMAVIWHWSEVTGEWAATDIPGSAPYNPLVFVDARTGYGFLDGYLQRTADTGATWERVAIDSPAGAGVSVLALGVGAGHVHALGIHQDGAMALRLYTMPIGGEAFLASAAEFAPPAGGEPSASFAFSGQGGLFAYNARTLHATATFVDGTWVTGPEYDYTCENGPLTFHSSGAELDMVTACDAGMWGDASPVGTRLTRFVDSGGDVPVPLPESGNDFVAVLARPEPGSLVIGSGDSHVFVTDDDGATWSQLDFGYTAGSVQQVEVAGARWVVLVGPGPDSDGLPTVLVSLDGGVTWS